jgi:glyoxylase I family protein
MSKLVTGIGGFFFRSKNPELLSKWYEKHFGINAVKSNHTWKQEAGITVFAPFSDDTKYFGRMEQQFMLNFRVSDLDELLTLLKNDGVEIDNEKLEETYGKFAWVYDPEGNKIELWEPRDETKL